VAELFLRLEVVIEWLFPQSPDALITSSMDVCLYPCLAISRAAASRISAFLSRMGVNLGPVGPSFKNHYVFRSSALIANS
jgi:hypothetical protein